MQSNATTGYGGQKYYKPVNNAKKNVYDKKIADLTRKKDLLATSTKSAQGNFSGYNFQQTLYDK
jgi:hypothetical protein